MNKSQIEQAIHSICSKSAVVAPRVAVKRLRGGAACYNPLLHKISVDTRIAGGLSKAECEILCAHEVGHVRQRKRLLRAILPHGLLIGLAIPLTTVLGLLIARSVPQMAIVTVLTFVAMQTVTNRMVKHLGPVTDQFESEADEFADTYVGLPGATKSILARCEELMERP